MATEPHTDARGKPREIAECDNLAVVVTGGQDFDLALPPCSSGPRSPGTPRCPRGVAGNRMPTFFLWPPVASSQSCMPWSWICWRAAASDVTCSQRLSKLLYRGLSIPPLTSE